MRINKEALEIKKLEKMLRDKRADVAPYRVKYSPILEQEIRNEIEFLDHYLP